MFPRPQRIHGDRRFVLIVLVESTNPFPSAGSSSYPKHKLGMFLLPQRRQRMREKFGLFKSRRRVQRDIELHPLRSGGLGKTLETEMFEDFAQPNRHLAALHDIGRRPGIQIKRHNGRTLDLRCQRQ